MVNELIITNLNRVKSLQTSYVYMGDLRSYDQ